jgi:DnaJ-class molecular chaperone
MKRQPGGLPSDRGSSATAQHDAGTPDAWSRALQYGEEGINEGMASGGGGDHPMADLFDMLSGGRGRGGPPRERKSEDVVHKLSVSLEELYNGVTK